VATARACAEMRAGKVRARAALLALHRMPRGCLEVRGEFACNLAGKATIVFGRDVRMEGQHSGKTKKSGEGRKESLTMCGIVRYVSEVSGMPKEKSPIPVCRFGSHFKRR
jgi:hypothetical protein